MIKGGTEFRDIRTDQTGKLLVIGLSAADVQRLMAGQPITFELSELFDTDPAVRVLIVGGETQRSLASDLTKHLGAVDRRDI